MVPLEWGALTDGVLRRVSQQVLPESFIDSGLTLDIGSAGAHCFRRATQPVFGCAGVLRYRSHLVGMQLHRAPRARPSDSDSPLEAALLMVEWSPLMSRLPGMLAKDFPLDTDVQAAIRGIELRLEHPEGTVVRART
jgi:hypothetical protein